MRTLPLATARKTFSEVVDQLERTHERVAITREGVPAAILISPADLESLEDTLDVLSNPATMQRLRASRADAARGDVLDGDLLGDLVGDSHRPR